jgi:hypothetical protein
VLELPAPPRRCGGAVRRFWGFTGLKPWILPLRLREQRTISSKALEDFFDGDFKLGKQRCFEDIARAQNDSWQILIFPKMVDPDFFSRRLDDPQLVDACVRVNHSFLIEIEMCGLRREDLESKQIPDVDRDIWKRL